MVQRINVDNRTRVPLEKDYHTAVVRLAAWERKEDARLLFGTIELLPRGVHPPVPSVHHHKDERPTHTLHFRYGTCAVRDALRLHQQVAAGGVIPLEDILGTSFEGFPSLSVGAMQQEPEWPELVFATQSVPFLATWHEQPRMHHLLARTPPRGADLVERERLDAWVSSRFFFSLEDHPEYRGSLHLIAPNPRFRDLSIGLDTAQQARLTESATITFHARSDADLEGLLLRVTALRPTGVIATREIPVRDTFVKVEFEHVIEKVEVEVFDPDRGLLHREQATQWRNRDGTTQWKLRRGAERRAAAQAWTLFASTTSSENGWPEDLPWDGALGVVVPRIDAEDLDMLREVARARRLQIYAMVEDSALPPSVTPSPDEPAWEEDGAIWLRTCARADRLRGNLLLVEARAWIFTGTCATLGAPGTFLQQIPESQPLLDHFWDLWADASWVGAFPAREATPLDLASLLSPGAA